MEKQEIIEKIQNFDITTKYGQNFQPKKLYIGYINGKQYCGYNGHRAYVRKNALRNSMIDFLTENLRYDRSFYRADNERKVKNQIKNIFDELVELGIIEIREV
jgi:hypothetical protein